MFRRCGHIREWNFHRIFYRMQQLYNNVGHILEAQLPTLGAQRWTYLQCVEQQRLCMDITEIIIQKKKKKYYKLILFFFFFEIIFKTTRYFCPTMLGNSFIFVLAPFFSQTLYKCSLFFRFLFFSTLFVSWLKMSECLVIWRHLGDKVARFFVFFFVNHTIRKWHLTNH